VLEALLVRVVPRLVEVVHVELAHERREVVVLEVAREDALCKLIRLSNNEAVPYWLAPAYYMVQLGILPTITQVILTLTMS
jgi:hypothetical protein